MKIYIIPVKEKFQPKSQAFRYPAHSADFGVEQDFYEFLLKNPALTTLNKKESDFHYLPIFWNRWHLNHDYGKDGLAELQKEFDEVVTEKTKTFTICQWDDGPLINTGEIILFLSARKTEVGIDIPVLCSPHRRPFFMPSKKYLASFAGRLENHPLREKMASVLKDKLGVQISLPGSTRFFVRQILSSYVCLSPRGYGRSSFRFFEAMQLGVTPFFISDIDNRPFKKFILWDTMSMYTDKPEKIMSIIESHTIEDLVLMGKKSMEFYNEHLRFGKWCKYVIKELEYHANNS